MEQQIQFCTTSDGVHLAFSTVGQGPPMIWPPFWVTHVEEEWKSPLIKDFFLKLASKYTIVRFDKHGCGLSDRDRTDFSLEKEVRDLESIIDHLGIKKCALFGMSQGGPTAIAYAAKHPESVSHLLLFGTWSRGDAGSSPKVKAALGNLIRTSWGLGSKTLADIFVPDGSKEIYEFFKNWQRKASTGEMAAQLLESENHIDVTELLPKVKTPTLVLHRSGDRACSVKAGREIAVSIPNARFTVFEGIDHLPWAGDSTSVLDAIEEFLDSEEVSDPEPLIEKRGNKKEFQRKLVAILSADVKGYSRLMNDDEEETINTLAACQALMSKRISKYRGRVVDSVGDNLLAEFSSVVDAVKCSVEIQEHLEVRNKKFPENRRMEYRIGVNLGDVIVEGDRLYGDGVNIASRIESLAEAGGVCISGTVYDQIENKLNLSFNFWGEQSVKNIPQPVRVYQIQLKPEDISSQANRHSKIRRIY